MQQPQVLLASTFLTVIATVVAPGTTAASDCLVERGRVAARTVNSLAASGPLIVAMQRGNWGERPMVRVFTAGPRRLAEVGTWEPRRYVSDVALRGTTAIVAADGGLVSLDLSNPRHPQEVGFIDLIDTEWLTIDGDLVYSVTTGAGGNGWFDVIDVSDPEDPQQRGELTWDRPDPFKMAIDARAGTAVIVDSDGLLILDVSDPWRPEEVARWQRHGARDVALFDGFAAVAVTSWVDPDDVAVEIVDLSNPEAPALVGRWQAPSAVHTVAAFGERVVAGTELDGVFLLDLGSPASPTVAEHLGTEGVVVRHLAGAWPSLVAGHNEQGLTVLGLHRSCLPPRRPAGRIGSQPAAFLSPSRILGLTRGSSASPGTAAAVVTAK
ncbi:MAG TPA: hypothetical protein VLT32_14890 [Candidatus Sulfomarinibacteraceae bacterium]|nr:hypothetical protein [Candidatus Sulfomarinibacteraceae bacterium]